MKAIVPLALVSVVLASCHLYFEEDEEDPAADAAVQPADDAAIPADCVPTTSARADLNACFDFDLYQNLGLCDLAVLSTNQGTCATCHAGGGDGIQINPDCDLTFRGWAVQENFEDLATIEEADGCISTLTVGKICSSMLIGGNVHPPFQCPNNIRDGFQQFLDTALAGARAGTCQ